MTWTLIWAARRWIGGGLAVLAIVGGLWLHLRHDAQAIVDRDAWHKSSDAWSRKALGFRSSFHAAEKIRKTEQAQAVAAVQADARACAIRVAEARRAVLAIHQLVTKEPPHDPHGCPVRLLDDPDQLRDALGAKGPAAR